MTIDAEIKFNAAQVERRVTGDLERKQKILDALVLRDSNLFCPKDTGALQNSAVIHTVIGSGEVVWQTPYAARQYFNWKGIRGHNRNPRATSKWFETAKAKYLNEWLEAINAEHS